MRLQCLCLAGCITGHAGSALAATWTVDSDGPADFDNIQAALDAASDGDEIVVEPGTYYEQIDFLGKSVWLHSNGGEHETIIDGQGASGSVVTIGSVEHGNSVLEGFTVQSASQTGPGITCNFASPTIRACTITNNSAEFGAGIRCLQSSPYLFECTISNNTGDVGGIYLFQSNAILTDCAIYGNTGEWAGGIVCLKSSPVLTRCTISQNPGNSPGSGCGLSSDYHSNPTLTDTTICGNGWTVQGPWTDNGGNCVAFSCDDNDSDGGPDECHGSTDDGVHEVPSEYATIQEAIEVAGYGDLVLVGPGTYTSSENRPVINPGGKPVTIRSTDGPEVTILDGEDARQVVHCVGNETSTTVIEGFTITGGRAMWGLDGGGVICSSSDPTLRDCIITNNVVDLKYDGSVTGGAGMSCEYSSPTLIGCTLSENTIDGSSQYLGRGGGLYCVSSHPLLVDCTITGNGAYLGGGVYCDAFSSPTLVNCPIVGNTCESVDWVGAGGGLFIASYITPTLIRATVCGNDAPQIAGDWTDGGGNLFWDDCDDCNDNGIDDLQDILNGTVTDVDTDGTPDECEVDCDGDGMTDPLEIFFGEATDWDGNGIPDDCQEDCDDDGYPDDWAIGLGIVHDCDESGVPDTCEVDCNGNGLHDSCDLADGTSEDGNTDGVPDECQCPGDINGSGSADELDLILVISQWGLLGGSADVNQDGAVGLADLLLVLTAWGPCEEG